MDTPNDPPGSDDDLNNNRPFDGGWIVITGEPRTEPQIGFDDVEPSRRARRLREKAGEVRKAAEQMIDDGARQSLRQVAEQYDRLAGRVDRPSSKAERGPDADD
jgi:hypothetical protein